MAALGRVFLDTSLLLLGLIDFGEASDRPMEIYDAVADQRLKQVSTAWHCCLEFYSVSTRLPIEFRIAPTEALHLLQEEVLPRFEILQLPQTAYLPFLISAPGGRVMGGRIYDAHIAEVARLSGADIVVSNNQRHFTHLLQHRIRVLTADQFAELL